MVFLGYSQFHKGFKCLEPKSGWVYISRDVIFDESIFPFEKLHPNAGARLRKEILLLRDHLLNSDRGGVGCDDIHATHISLEDNVQQEMQEIKRKESPAVQSDADDLGAGSDDDFLDEDSTGSNADLHGASEVVSSSQASPRGGQAAVQRAQEHARRISRRQMAQRELQCR